jgi:DNA-binding MarR family transcriptional regulator
MKPGFPPYEERMNAALPSPPFLQEQDNEADALDQGMLLRLVGYNCQRAYLNIFALFIERMARYDLRPVDYTILTLTNANPDLSQKRLAHAIKVSPPNLTPLIDKLEKRDLIARARNPTDKRSQVLALTPEGKRLCEAADKMVFELEHEATAMLADDERAELLRLLQKIFR